MKGVPLLKANMGGEDFAYYLSSTPGAFFRIGARPESISEGHEHPAHSAKFDFQEDALMIGTLLLFHLVFQQ